MGAFKPEPALLQRLMEIGYLATGSGMHTEAEAIFDSICALRPESELPIIGLAVMEMNRGEPLRAGHLLRDRALRLNPESALAKSFLGFSLRLAGSNQEGMRVLEEVIGGPHDDVAVAMAESLLKETI